MTRRVPLLWRASTLACALALACASASRAAEEAAPPAEPGLPRPAFLVAEPTPNDNGTRVTVRWPRPDAWPEGWRYVVYISLDPSWRWFECGAVGPREGLLTSRGIAPFYPYHFSPGDEQYFIVSPLEVDDIAAYWLPAERQVCGWVEGSRATLQESQSKLAGLRDLAGKRLAFRAVAARYRPGWEAQANRAGPGQQAAAEFLKSTAKREKDMGVAILEERDSVLDDLARYLLANAVVSAEAEAMLVSQDAEDPAAMRRDLEKAAAALRIAQPTAEDRDNYDRLAYALDLALLRWQLGDTSALGEDITGQALWQLDALTREADLPPDLLEARARTEKAAPAPDDAALAAALKAWHAALSSFERDSSEGAEKQWATAAEGLERATQQWQEGMRGVLVSRLAGGRLVAPPQDCLGAEISRLGPIVEGCQKRLKQMQYDNSRRPYWFRLGLQTPSGERLAPFDLTASAASHAAVFDMSTLVNLVFAVGFTAAVLFMVAYVRHHPDVFVRRIAGLEAVDEAIGRATEMGKPVLFVHGLTGVGDISLLASVNILGRLGRQVAEYDSDLLVANNDPLVFSLSQEVVQEAYLEAGRPDAYRPDNVFMVASDQFPYAAAVAGIMSRRRPAANFFMGFFYAEALILAERGAMTGAIQIAGTDSFTQLPFFITTCDYTLMGEELYAASAYLSRNARLLATLKAQDMGKAVLLASLPVGTALCNLGLNWVQVIYTAYDKGF